MTMMLRNSSIPKHFYFPPDLVACVLGNLHSDQRTLKNCSLTCQSWVYLAQAHIFYTVTVDTDMKLHKLWDLLKKRPHLAGHIRVLHINPHHRHIEAQGLQVMQEWICDVPIFLEPLLTNLRALHLDRIDYQSFGPDSRFAEVLGRFRRTQRLYLTSCSFARFEDFESLVLAFPRSTLTALSTDLVSFEDECCSFSGKAQPLSLKSVRIGRFCRLDVTALWLLSSHCMSSLTELELYVVGASEIELVGMLLCQLGPALRQLKLGCKFDGAPQMQRVLGDHLKLWANTGLQSLHLRVLDLMDDYMAWVPWVLRDLGAPGGPNLRYITFDVWLFGAWQLRTRAWDDVERVLDNPRYAGLEKVTFIQRGHMDTDIPLSMAQLRTAMRQRFPGLDARHILRVDDGNDYVGMNNL